MAAKKEETDAQRAKRLEEEALAERDAMAKNSSPQAGSELEADRKKVRKEAGK